MPTLWNDNGYPVEFNLPIAGIQNGTIACGPILVTGSGVTVQVTDAGTAVPKMRVSGSTDVPVVQFMLPPFPLMVVPKNANNPLGIAVSGAYGFKVTDVCLQYVIGTASCSSMTFAAYTSLQIDAAAPVTAGTAFGGTWTFNEPPVQPTNVAGTGALNVTTSANINNVQCLPAVTVTNGPPNAPWYHTDMGNLVFYWSWTMGTNSTVDIYGIQIHGLFGLFG